MVNTNGGSWWQPGIHFPLFEKTDKKKKKEKKQQVRQDTTVSMVSPMILTNVTNFILPNLKLWGPSLFSPPLFSFLVGPSSFY